jgi:hypothetical protein
MFIIPSSTTGSGTTGSGITGSGITGSGITGSDITGSDITSRDVVIGTFLPSKVIGVVNQCPVGTRDVYSLNMERTTRSKRDSVVVETHYGPALKRRWCVAHHKPAIKFIGGQKKTLTARGSTEASHSSQLAYPA